MNYAFRVLVAFDQFANVVIGGSPDETISARSGRLQFQYPWTWGVLARLLNTVQPGHTEGAIEHDEGRAEEVVLKEKDAEKEGL